VLLGAIIEMGASLGIESVAEGIERPEQAQALRALGCHKAQGFWFAPPLPAAELEAFVGMAPLTVEDMATRR
jgi:EAL domain-containing protein (putative c-di-GMP-specific phosphodiesterase class I)